MKLKTHIAKKKLKRASVAKKLKISLGQLSKLINERQLPSLELAMKIHRFTKGAVTLPDYFRKPA